VVRVRSLVGWDRIRKGRAAAAGLATAALITAGLAGATTVVAAPPGGSGPQVAVIVRADDGMLSRADQAIAEAGGRVTAHIGLIDASAADIPASVAAWLAAQPGVAEVTPDAPVQLAPPDPPASDPEPLSTIETELGVTRAWADGYTGEGVGVALIDTGVSPVEGLDNPFQVVDGPDLSFDAANPQLRNLDENGHGTFMAGIIAGHDPAAGGSDAGGGAGFLGIAPDARILSVKVAGANGAVDVSQVLAAIDWVVQHRDDLGMNIRVLNLSFGTDSLQPYLVDPLAFAAEAAWHQGIVVVAAAGNQGAPTQVVADPAIDPFVIAVGASAPAPGGGFQLAPFSRPGTPSRGPDIVAPGTSVVSLADPGSVVADQFGSTGAVGTRFFRGSGTSEATAIVSGLAALLVQEHPAATPDQIKALLTSTAVRVRGGPPYASGHGEVMAGAAVASPLPDTVQSWPRATGTGSLQGSRGTLMVTTHGVPLVGDQDIFGNRVDTGALADLEAEARAWSGGTWNAATWTGDHWILDLTRHTYRWAYAPWTGESWAGIPWSSVSGDTGLWTGTSWSGTSWSGTSWSGTSWSGTSWSGTSWSGTSWSTAWWASASWS
jgi:serine protease AprX